MAPNHIILLTSLRSTASPLRAATLQHFQPRTLHSTSKQQHSTSLQHFHSTSTALLSSKDSTTHSTALPQHFNISTALHSTALQHFHSTSLHSTSEQQRLHNTFHSTPTTLPQHFNISTTLLQHFHSTNKQQHSTALQKISSCFLLFIPWNILTS